MSAQRKPLTTLITGGAGFLGINLCRYLLARGRRVASLDLAPFDYPERDRVIAITGDVRDASTLSAAFEGVDEVVHAAAALPLAPPGEIRSTTVDGTRRVLEAARQAAVAKVVYISSTAVYPLESGRAHTEDEQVRGVGPYGLAKVAAEGLCAEARGRGQVVTVLRPRSFVGPERLGIFSLLFDWAETGHDFPLLNGGTNRFQMLDVEDLCDAIVLCLDGPPERVNDTFNIGARDYGTLGEACQAVLDAAGHGGRVRSLPAAPALLALRMLDRLQMSPVYAWVYETAVRDSFVSIARAEAQLGFTPRWSNETALLRNHRWYVENRAQFGGSTGISHRVPWRQGALGLAKALFRARNGRPR